MSRMARMAPADRKWRVWGLARMARNDQEEMGRWEWREDKGKALADMYKVLFIMDSNPCLQMFSI